MLKGYYLFAPVEVGCVGPESGVERKVRAQCRALSLYTDCELKMLPVASYPHSALSRIVRRLPGTAAWRKWKYSGEFHDADFLYIRQVYHDASFTRYLRAIRRDNPSIKIIYEVPTYPYETESRDSLLKWPFVIKERHGCRAAARYIDRIVTFYGQEKIWGVPCLQLMNGFDFSAVELPKREPSDTIQVISVSVSAFWHGYDRFLEGLHRYYENGGTENIVYHMVGTPLPEYTQMARAYGLKEHVVLHGKQHGDALKAIYHECTVGIDVLGGHRKNYPISSSLKSREYGAYGLSVLTSSPIDYLPSDCPHQFRAPYDDSPVDIAAFLEQYHRLYDGKDVNEVAADIREFAKAHCDMVITMKPVADWLMDT